MRYISWDKASQEGSVHLLLLIAAVGIIAFTTVSALTPFKNNLFATIFPKQLTHAAGLGDVTGQIETLGNPFTAKPMYGRNVWDMQLFGNKIYLGHGDSAANLGPVPIYHYDPANNQFKTDYTAPEDQIDVFKVIDNKLMFPGHDPREDFSFGNYYVLEDYGWEKYRNLRGPTVHAYDLYMFNNRLFASGGGAGGGYSNIVFSDDKGITWQPVICRKPDGTSLGYCYEGARTYGMFEIANSLYSTSMFGFLNPATNKTEFSKVLKYLGGNEFTMLDLDGSVSGILFKGWGAPVPAQGCTTGCKTPEWDAARVEQPVVHQPTGRTIYIGAMSVNDHQWLPFNLYSAKSLAASDILAHRDANGNSLGINIENAPANSLWRPRDLLIDTDNTIYLLGHIRNPSTGQFSITVHKSTDAINFTEVFRFTNQTFARSFEKFNGYFYFGLGGDFGSVNNMSSPEAFIFSDPNLSYAPTTGTIIRFNYNDARPTPVPTPTPTPGTPVTTSFQIKAGADDVNEEGANFSGTSGFIWYSTGSSLTNDWMGLRFQNVIIPKGAIVSSAKVQLYAPQTSNIGIRMFTAAENVGNSTAFSTTSRPSQKTLTTTWKNHYSSDAFTAGNWYELDQIKNVVQEVINRPDWNSGNSLSLLMKGTGVAFERKFVSSFESVATQSAKLNVTYYVQSSAAPSSTPTLAPSPSQSPSPSPSKVGDISGITGVKDNKVDIWDYNKLLSDFGMTGTNLVSDIEKAGTSLNKVDIFDYNTLLSNFGT